MCVLVVDAFNCSTNISLKYVCLEWWINLEISVLENEL